jgi:hypothetical protein
MQTGKKDMTAEEIAAKKKTSATSIPPALPSQQEPVWVISAFLELILLPASSRKDLGLQ